MSYGCRPPQCRPQMICKYNTICAIGKAKTPFFELRPTARATAAGPVGRRRTQVSRGTACPSAHVLLPYLVTHCATARCKTAHFTLRNGPFRNAIRAVSQGEMGRFANRYGHGRGRGRHFLPNRHLAVSAEMATFANNRDLPSGISVDCSSTKTIPMASPHIWQEARIVVPRKTARHQEAPTSKAVTLITGQCL